MLGKCTVLEVTRLLGLTVAAVGGVAATTGEAVIDCCCTKMVLANPRGLVVTEAVFPVTLVLPALVNETGTTVGVAIVVVIGDEMLLEALGGGMLTGPVPGMGADCPEWLCVV